MSETASLYRNAAMISEEPTMQTLVMGLRGLRTYLARAARALELDNTEAKIVAVTRANDLLTFLQGITQPEGEDSLGAALSGLYASFHLEMTQAHAANDVAQFREIATQIGLLENVFKKLAD